MGRTGGVGALTLSACFVAAAGARRYFCNGDGQRGRVRLRLVPCDTLDAIDRPIERDDLVDAARLRLRHQVGLGEVQASEFVDLERAQQ